MLCKKFVIAHKKIFPPAPASYNDGVRTRLCLLVILCLALSGCLVIPYSTDHIEMDSGLNPFSRITVGYGETYGPHIIKFYLDIEDSERDLRGLTIRDLVIVDAKGRTFHLPVPTQKSATATSPLHGAWVDIWPKENGEGLSLKTPFKIKFVATLEGENLVVDGTCHEASELHVTNAWEIGR